MIFMASKKTKQKLNKKKIKLVTTSNKNRLSEEFPFKEKVPAMIELMRIGNCIMALIAILIGFALSNGTNYSIALLAALSGFFICAGGQAINDYFDYKIDAKLSKDKPIPSGRVSRKEALWFSIDLFILGNFLAYSINPLAMNIALAFTFLLVIYPALMNRVKYLGNFIVAGGTAITFIFGSVATGGISSLVIALAISAFFANIAREITKDIQDTKKDSNTKRTLPMIVGNKIAKLFVSAYYLLAIFSAILIYFLFLLNAFYLVFILLSSAVFIYSILLLQKDRAKESQAMAKIGMIFSMVGFVLILI
jgi:geranylgeranylglycerol-phosphate geranylgeranyltransferase